MKVIPFKGPSSHGDRGKWAEAHVANWLEDRTNREVGFAYHRYPDARAARGALAAQPADFLVAIKRPKSEPRAVHLEVKETAEVRRLPRSKITQYGKLGMFDLAGFETFVVVYRSHHADWTYFSRGELFGDDDVPTSFPFAGRPTFDTAAHVLQEIL